MTPIHAEGVRAVARTIAQLERDGSCFVQGVYCASEAMADSRRAQLAAQAVRRDAWNARRAGFAVVIDADTALEVQRLAVDDAESTDESFPPQGDTAWEVEYWRMRAFAVKCGWCSVEMQAGNPSLPVSHGICDTCAAKLAASEVA
ncbi:MAG: hypothetical protein H0U66_06240 [Gemmatimonadaceae bacterium]|nr:hypothetical protein [Gemmatimonadaceae bacterium]